MSIRDTNLIFFSSLLVVLVRFFVVFFLLSVLNYALENTFFS